MTSPPYFLPELYNNELSQSSIKLVNHEEWWKGFLARRMQTSANSGCRANLYQESKARRIAKEEMILANLPGFGQKKGEHSMTWTTPRFAGSIESGNQYRLFLSEPWQDL
jgi:hypothetical protein